LEQEVLSFRLLEIVRAVGPSFEERPFTVGIELMQEMATTSTGVLEPQKTKANVFYPVKYAYKKDAVFHLSAKEKLICDVYLQTHGNLHAAIVAVKEKFGRTLNQMRVKEWFDRKPHLKEYLNKRISEMAEYNMTKEEYVARTLDMATSEGYNMNSTKAFLWKLVGQAKGFLAEQQGPVVQNNMQINILQADGQA